MDTPHPSPKFVTKSAFTVVGLLIHTTAKDASIPQLWDRFVPRMGEITHGIEPYVSYGLMDYFNPQTSSLDYMAGSAVSAVDVLPSGMSRWDIPANTYAVFDTTLMTIPATFDFIFGTWLSTSSYQQVAAPYFEYYGADFSPDNPVLSVYIPVSQKSS